MERENETRTRLQNALIFQRNVDETTLAARNAIDSKRRKKHNDPEYQLQSTPTTADFKNFMRSYAETVEHQSQNMKVIGKLLQEDKFYQRRDPKRAEQKSIVQNMFDGFRYTAPLLKNLAVLRIPITEENARLSSE